VDEQVSWRTLTEMEVSFGRSRRRSALRRERRPKPASSVPRSWRVGALTLLLFVLLAAESGSVGRSAKSRAPQRASAAAAAPSCPIPAGFRPAFVTASRKASVPLPLLVAIAYHESRMDPAARSGAGAQGLLQLMPSTARELQLDPADPNANVLAGALYLRKMLDRFPSVQLALAAYNAGPTAVEQAGGAPTGETLVYVEHVTASWRLLRGCR
jgi:soluble lytic murein transglycosylase-like protein